MKVSIVEYRSEWPEMFAQERQRLQALLADDSVQIEHVGSTAVPNLAAKPIIDIMIGVRDLSVADALIPTIESLNYAYLKKYEELMPFRRFFIKGSDEDRTHQIHLVEIGTEFWDRIILFRDYLRKNPDVAVRYAELKMELSNRTWEDVNAYAEAKSEFVRGIEKEASLGSKSSVARDH